jgi:purine-nucleoside phosphorylase
VEHSTREFDRVAQAAEQIARRGGAGIELALVLGSGLGPFADELTDPTVIPYQELPGFPQPTVPGHSGRLVLGTIAGVRVAVLQGRAHYYEGHSAADAVRPLRTLITLGAQGVVVTNAAGGIHPEFAVGDLMLISDHLNLTGVSPAIGPHEPRWPSRFQDMADAYDPAWRALFRRSAASLGLPLREGVYAGLPGGAYETPAEIRMLRTLGADAVGMSTVLEVIAARHLGARTVGISCITNLAAGIAPEPLNHAEVEQTAVRVRAGFASLLRDALPQLLPTTTATR